MNFVFISPHFPHTYWNFCQRLKQNGVTVLGIADAPYESLPHAGGYTPDMINYAHGTDVYKIWANYVPASSADFGFLFFTFFGGYFGCRL